VYADANAPSAHVEVDTATFDAALGAYLDVARNSQNLRGQYSTWLVDVFVPATGWVRNRVTDPYAISLSANGRRTWLGSLQDPETLPEHWQDAPRPAAAEHAVDQIIYELHVRDFSRDDARCPRPIAASIWALRILTHTACNTCAPWPKRD
jgi:pullulanase/glycogen debranching enzyme